MRAARYMTGPLFSTKCIWLTQFLLIGIWKAPLFLTSWYIHIFFTQRFLRLLVLLVFELTALFVLTTSNKRVQKNQTAVYEWVNISDDLLHKWVRFFKGQVYEWGRFPNTGSHTHTKITLQLPRLHPPPPPPPPPTHMRLKTNGWNLHSMITAAKLQLQSKPGLFALAHGLYTCIKSCNF